MCLNIISPCFDPHFTHLPTSKFQFQIFLLVPRWITHDSKRKNQRIMSYSEKMCENIISPCFDPHFTHLPTSKFHFQIFLLVPRWITHDSKIKNHRNMTYSEKMCENIISPCFDPHFTHLPTSKFQFQIFLLVPRWITHDSKRKNQRIMSYSEKMCENIISPCFDPHFTHLPTSKFQFQIFLLVPRWITHDSKRKNNRNMT